MYLLEILSSYRPEDEPGSDSGIARNLKSEAKSYRSVRQENIYFCRLVIFRYEILFVPGLSARNRKMTYPLFGTAIVSLEGGRSYFLCKSPRLSRSRACFKLMLFTFSSGDLPIPITLNAYPCKWKGCERFGCCTRDNLVYLFPYRSSFLGKSVRNF